MPGRDKLVSELGVSGNTMEAALRQLRKEGLLDSGGAGRKRRILLPDIQKPRSYRVGLFLFESADAEQYEVVKLGHQLFEAGHSLTIAEKTLLEMRMDVRRIARSVEKSNMDAWVVFSGSWDVLEWFSTQPTPVFALYGRRRGLPIAGIGPDKPSAYAAVTRRLLELGHRRVVLLAHRNRRIPEPGASERAFLDELEAGGITPGQYHLPDWQESPDGLNRQLEALFLSTPPTALILDELRLYLAAQQFLLHRGLRVPQDVSMVCTDSHPNFAWCTPSPSHIHWDPKPVTRRILRWVSHVARGLDDRRQSLINAKFVEGGTIGRHKPDLER